MRHWLLCSIFLLLKNSGFVWCQGNKIVFPDAVPDLIDELGIDSGLRSSFNFQNSGNSCKTETGASGECVPLRECPELLSYVRSRGIRTNEDVRFFRGRICKFLFNNVNLCCVKATPLTGPISTRTTPKPEAVKLPTRDECGFTTVSRITDGIEISHGSHPWLAGVGFPRDDGSFRVLCGATLITQRHVLTAAHCFVRRPGMRISTHVRLGEHNLRSDEGERQPPITLKIESRKDPGYNSVSHVNDIALIVLEGQVEFTTYIRPACLPFGFESRNFESEQLIIVGWGDTFHRSFEGSDVPLAANISVISKPECREAYVDEPQVPLDNTQFCAGRGSKDACQGDSGGPLLLQDLREHLRYFLLGIVSFGVGCANPAFPGVYTFIPEFLTWITDNL